VTGAPRPAGVRGTAAPRAPRLFLECQLCLVECGALAQSKGVVWREARAAPQSKAPRSAGASAVASGKAAFSYAERENEECPEFFCCAGAPAAFPRAPPRALARRPMLEGRVSDPGKAEPVKQPVNK
jgi:hypothetical protein